MTTLTLQDKHGTYTISVKRDDMPIGDMMEHVVRLLLAAGYQPENINEYIAED